MMLPTRKLGRTGLDVSILGFGGAPLGDLYALLDDDAALRAVATALDVGRHAVRRRAALRPRPCRAPLRHGAEAPAARFLRALHQGRTLAQAGAAAARPRASRYRGGLSFDVVVDYSYDGTMRAFEQSLQRLALPSIDIALIHDVDVWTHGDQIETRFREAMDGAYRALDRSARARRSSRAIGVGVNESAMCVRFANAGDIDAVLLAGRYSLLEQPALDGLPAARREEAHRRDARRRVQLRHPGDRRDRGRQVQLSPGAARDPRARRAKIEAVCASHDVALPVAAMQFALGHPAVASLVIGAVAPAEVTPQRRGADRARAGRALVAT